MGLEWACLLKWRPPFCRSTRSTRYILALISTPTHHPRVPRVNGARWGGRDDLGWAWERVEGNLGVRAAMAVAKLVEKGRVVGLGACHGVF